MSVLEIVTYPGETLKKKALEVKEVTPEIQKLADDMAETMYVAPGIGLAANQVGVLKRVIVLDVEYSDGEPNLIVAINPQIVSRSGEITWEEGCLSLPEVNEEVVRSERVVVRGLNRQGEPFEIDAQGLLAVALQHEIDHLEGKTLLDRVSYLKKRILSKQLIKRRG